MIQVKEILVKLNGSEVRLVMGKKIILTNYFSDRCYMIEGWSVFRVED